MVTLTMVGIAADTLLAVLRMPVSANDTLMLLLLLISDDSDVTTSGDEVIVFSLYQFSNVNISW